MNRLSLIALAILVVGCSRPAEAPDFPANVGDAASHVSVPKAASPEATSSPSPAASGILTLEGLGDLRIGEPVAKGSRWAERGAQTGENCRTINSPEYPGVYAILTDGKVQRITIGQRSDVTLIEGIGIGATEQQVRAAFPGFEEEPHKYVDAPAKYLTTPGADRGGSALRFEIGRDGKVAMIHVGLMPVLAYVEACA